MLYFYRTPILLNLEYQIYCPECAEKCAMTTIFFASKLVYLKRIFYICITNGSHKIAPYWIGKLFKSYEIPETSFLLQWRATPLRYA